MSDDPATVVPLQHPTAPTIVLVSETRGDELREHFGRYEREYDLRTATSCAEAEEVADRVRTEGGTAWRRTSSAMDASEASSLFPCSAIPPPRVRRSPRCDRRDADSVTSRRNRADGGLVLGVMEPAWTTLMVISSTGPAAAT